MLKLAKLNNQPEIFHTIQGEGKSIGKPSVFIRLSLCNLYCQWCDTDYTWNWEGTKHPHNNEALAHYKKYKKEELITFLSDEDIVGFMQEMQAKNVVITGGEPLVQQKDLISLLKLLRQRRPSLHLEFETNGTLIPLPEVDALTDQYNVSLKLGNSGVSLQERLVPGAIQFFASSPKSNFKFVINSEEDLKEVLDLVVTYQLDNERVYLMPQGTTALVLKEKQMWLAEICKKHNFNYTDRLHVHIWGDKRGV